MNTLTRFKDFTVGLPGNARVELVIGGVVLPAFEFALVHVDGEQTVRLIADMPEAPLAPKRKAKEPV